MSAKSKDRRLGSGSGAPKILASPTPCCVPHMMRHDQSRVLAGNPRTRRSGSARRAKQKAQAAARLRSQFVGCLLGGAIGDALGAPVEFMSQAEIIARFGPAGITDFAPAYGRLGAITDDTQMTLFTAEGLIRAHVRFADRGLANIDGMLAAAYRRWLCTQAGQAACASRKRDLSGWLMAHPELHHRRGPGATCLSAIGAMDVLGAPAANDSKGCGGVMRIAPVGLLNGQGGDPPAVTMDLAKRAAALTHGHPTGSIAASALAVLIADLVNGRDLGAGLATVHACLDQEPAGAETRAALAVAEELARTSPGDPVAAIGQIGQGWVAEEALAIGVYCALTARDFADGVIRAVNHDGDSDSTGSITGQILGTLWGRAAIPEAFLAPLELRDVIEEMACDLAECRSWPIVDHDNVGRRRPDPVFRERVWAKYPGN